MDEKKSDQGTVLVCWLEQRNQPTIFWSDFVIVVTYLVFTWYTVQWW
jgi:hypothetical protein